MLHKFFIFMTLAHGEPNRRMGASKNRSERLVHKDPHSESPRHIK
jgi:hypothetical protein